MEYILAHPEYILQHPSGTTHILSLITYLPLLGAVIIALFLPRGDQRAPKVVATIITVLTFVLSLVMLSHFQGGTHKLQLVEYASWIPSIGVSYFLGIDGISILLVLLTTLLSVIVVVCSYSQIEENENAYYACLLFLETGMLGVFVALDFFLFYIFWEIMLVPMYFLIGIWGHGRRLYSAIKFFLYTLFGSVFMLLGILALYFFNGNHDYGTGKLTFNVIELINNLKVPTQPIFAGLSAQDLIFLAFFLGFAIKVPMFPFHTWLPDAHTDAPTAGSVILAAVLLKMGTYGFLRFSLPILPDATRHFVPMVAVLCIIGIVYGALVALAQKDWKRLVAYSSVSHMALVMLGMFALNPAGIIGSIIQQLNHGISTGALFLLVGVVYERRHTREISEYGGLSKVMPAYAAVFLIMTMSSIGLPGLNGFIGELLILLGVFVASKVWAAFAASGVVLGAAYMLYLYQRTMFGKVENPKNEHLLDLSNREFATFAPLLVLAVWMGLYPAPFLRRLDMSVQHVIARVSPQYIQQNAYADCGAAPTPAMVAANSAAKFLASVPCGPDG